MLTGTPTNSVNDDIYKLIKQLESSGKDRLALYTDHIGIPTIGIGYFSLPCFSVGVYICSCFFCRHSHRRQGGTS